MYYDLKHDKLIETQDSGSLRFMYETVFGRLILKIAATKAIADLYARYMNSGLSKRKIKGFIEKNHINMDEYQPKNYRSLNDFFIREIKPERRQIEDGVFAVCDSKLTVYPIDENSAFKIKDSIYTVEELIGEKRDYKNALVFRLCVDDYHHYIFPDNGRVVSSKYIKGVLHTVQPIAFKRYKVFHENSREITFLDCDKLGDVCYIEVGAMMVGKIVNRKVDTFNIAEEKGHFEFGGSTVIMLIDKEIDFNDKIIRHSQQEIETIVKMGQCIGRLR